MNKRIIDMSIAELHYHLIIKKLDLIFKDIMIDKIDNEQIKQEFDQLYLKTLQDIEKQLEDELEFIKSLKNDTKKD